MKSAKEILDSLHPIEKEIVLRDFARQKEEFCKTCPFGEFKDGDQPTQVEQAGVAETADTAYRPDAEISATGKEQIKILWVDDDKVVHAIAKKLLNAPELDLHQAESGYEALDLLGENQYDLLITDLGMPVMTGWQLTAKIKGKYPNMQIAILTGLSYDISPQVMEQHGVLYCLRKPMTKEDAAELLEQVRENR